MKISILRNMPKHALKPVPLFFYQPFLNRIIRFITKDNPHLFARLGVHDKKTFVIQPVNLPFVFILKPQKENPRIQIKRNANNLSFDALIKGSFLNLMHLVDGQKDGDALFFSRDLIIEGDTEAVVCLRNALDDMDKSVIEQIASKLGSPGLRALDRVRKINT